MENYRDYVTDIIEQWLDEHYKDGMTYEDIMEELLNSDNVMCVYDYDVKSAVCDNAETLENAVEQCVTDYSDIGECYANGNYECLDFVIKKYWIQQDLWDILKLNGIDV